MIHFGVKVICIEPGFFRTNMSSSDVIQRQFEKLWAKLPQEIREDYGNDYIDKGNLHIKTNLFHRGLFCI